MEKMLFNTPSGNLYEVLQKGGGPDYNRYVVEIWMKEQNEWVRAGIEFDTLPELPEQEVLKIAKEKAEQSVWE